VAQRLFSPRVSEQGGIVTARGDLEGNALVGAWKKVGSSACAEKYPASITFSTGTYRGTRGSGQGMVWWDAGIYRVEGQDKLVVGTATDELVEYRIELRGDRLNVTDPDGCRFSYECQSPNG
jgi:hypothetical protein